MHNRIEGISVRQVSTTTMDQGTGSLPTPGSFIPPSIDEAIGEAGEADNVAGLSKSGGIVGPLLAEPDGTRYDSISP